MYNLFICARALRDFITLYRDPQNDRVQKAVESHLADDALDKISWGYGELSYDDIFNARGGGIELNHLLPFVVTGQYTAAAYIDDYEPAESRLILRVSWDKTSGSFQVENGPQNGERDYQSLEDYFRRGPRWVFNLEELCGSGCSSGDEKESQ